MTTEQKPVLLSRSSDFPTSASPTTSNLHSVASTSAVRVGLVLAEVKLTERTLDCNAQSGSRWRAARSQIDTITDSSVQFRASGDRAPCGQAISLRRTCRGHRRIHEEAVVKIGSETSAGFSRHPFGIILSECVARERQEMRFGDSHSL